jgi:DNA adenine methylase
MSKIDLASPVLKWVGGKRQLLDRLTPLFPKTYTNYCEPFIGGGAVLFSLQPKNAVINDINSELIGVYNTIKNDVDALIERLTEFENTKDCFYDVRSWDRDVAIYNQLTDIDKAARVIFLNKTCYNGLYRVNSAGEFNTPFGRYKNPNIVNESTLRAVNEYFNTANVKILNGSYLNAVKGLPKGSFVYLDPPYDPISVTASFTGYNAGGFSQADQIELRDCCRQLDAEGIKFMLSNSATEFIQDIYQDFNITIVPAKRAINSIGSKRGFVDEVVVRNYE